MFSQIIKCARYGNLSGWQSVSARSWIIPSFSHIASGISLGREHPCLGHGKWMDERMNTGSIISQAWDGGSLGFVMIILMCEI